MGGMMNFCGGFIFPVIGVVMMIICFVFFKYSGGWCFGQRQIRDTPKGNSPSINDEALNVLNIRYAKGEISKADYEQMKKAMSDS